MNPPHPRRNRKGNGQQQQQSSSKGNNTSDNDDGGVRQKAYSLLESIGRTESDRREPNNWPVNPANAASNKRKKSEQGGGGGGRDTGSIRVYGGEDIGGSGMLSSELSVGDDYDDGEVFPNNVEDPYDRRRPEYHPEDQQRNALLADHTEQPEEDPNNLQFKDYDSQRILDADVAAAAASSQTQRSEKALTDDIYSLMYICKMGGPAYWFAIFVFLSQAYILAFIFKDLVHITSDPPVTPNGTVNRFHIPAGNEMWVSIAQFVGTGLTLSFMASGGDLLKGLDFLFNGFDYEVAKVKPGATRFKWAMAGILQALVGFVMTIDLFILMMQSTGVISMCLNFAALHFVQDIDDVAFQVAINGLISRRIEVECKEVGEVMINGTMKNRTRWMRRIVMLTMAIGLYGGFFVIIAYQISGKFRCTTVNIQFGDYYFPELPYYTGRFNVQGFSLTSLHSSRPIFIDESEKIKLRYSRAASAWLIQKNTNDDPDYMVKSSETQTFDVSTLAGTTWFANTESGDLPMDFMDILCADCIESRCNSSYGECQNNRCVCNEGRIGPSCEADEPKCQTLALDLRTKNAVANIPGASFFYNYQFQNLGVLVDTSISFYGRNLYVPFQYGTAFDRETIYHFIAFTGRRWVIFGAPPSRVADQNMNDFLEFVNKTQFRDATEIEGLKSLNEARGYGPLFFSTPVDYGTTTFGYDPTTVSWVFAKKIEQNPLAPDNIFGYGPNDDDPVPAQFLCSDCTESPNFPNCPNGGRCNEIGYCMCLPFYSGYQCEYIHSCDELGCFNGGTCNKLTGGCEDCIPDASGTLCQYPLPPKIKENKYFCNVTNGLLGPCLNRQKCNGIDMVCECDDPFYGELCENSTQADCFLASWPSHSNASLSEGEYQDACQNGGYCDWLLEWPICRCKDPYRGDFCELGPNDEA